MSLTQKVAYNFVGQVVGKGVSTVLGIVTIALMMRYLNKEGFGNYSTVMAYLTFFAIIIEFGLHLTTISLVAKNLGQEKKYLSNIFTLRLFSSLALFTLAPLLIWLFPYPTAVKWGVVVITFSFIFVSLTNIVIATMQLHLQTINVAIGENVGRLVHLALTLFIVYYNLGFLLLLSSIVLGSAANFFYNYYFLHRRVRLSLAFDFAIWKEVMAATWPIGLCIVFNLIYLKADMLILSLVRSQSEVGIYGATYKFVDILTTVPAMFMGLILPVLTANYAQNNLEKFKRVFQKSFDFLVLLSLPIIFGTFFLAKKIILLIAGPAFLEAVPVLQLIIFAIFAIFVGGGLYGYTVVALNKQRQMIGGYLVTAVFSFVGYLIFIPKYSYFGAAAMTIVSEFLISIFLFVMVYKTTKIIPKGKIFFKSLFACFFLSAVLYLLRPANIFICLIVGAISYFTALYLLKGITKEMILEVIKINK